MTTNIQAFYHQINQWWLANEFCDPAGVFCLEATFEEVFCARAAVQWYKALGFDKASNRPSTLQEALPDAMIRQDIASNDMGERLKQSAVAFANKVVDHQGVQGPPPALFMGYGMKMANGLPTHSCVADQASVATAVVETLLAFPDHPNAPQWQNCIERWADWVIENFVAPNGGIGVGIFSHRWNPIPEYWCATSLFAESLFMYTAINPREKYIQAATGALNWLANFDFQKTEIPKFEDCPCEVIFYAAPGIIAGLNYLGDHPAKETLKRMLTWLADNQQVDGNWPVPISHRGYHAYTMGLPWVLNRTNHILPTGCVEKFWNFANSPAGNHFFGLFIRPYSMALAWFSAGYFVEKGSRL